MLLESNEVLYSVLVYLTYDECLDVNDFLDYYCTKLCCVGSRVKIILDYTFLPVMGRLSDEMPYLALLDMVVARSDLLCIFYFKAVLAAVTDDGA